MVSTEVRHRRAVRPNVRSSAFRVRPVCARVHCSSVGRWPGRSTNTCARRCRPSRRETVATRWDTPSKRHRASLRPIRWTLGVCSGQAGSCDRRRSSLTRPALGYAEGQGAQKVHAVSESGGERPATSSIPTLGQEGRPQPASGHGPRAGAYSSIDARDAAADHCPRRSWDTLYEAAVEDIDLLPDVQPAVTWAHAFVQHIVESRGMTVPVCVANAWQESRP